MNELEKRYITEAIKKKYAEMLIEEEKNMVERYLVGNEGNPIVQE